MIIRMPDSLFQLESLLVSEIRTLFRAQLKHRRISWWISYGYSTLQIRSTGRLDAWEPPTIPASHLCFYILWNEGTLHCTTIISQATTELTHLSPRCSLKDINETLPCTDAAENKCSEGESSPTLALPSPNKWCGKVSHFHNSWASCDVQGYFWICFSCKRRLPS